MIRLTEQQVLSVHDMMTKATGSSFGVRDMGLLNSSLNVLFQSFGYKDRLSIAIVKGSSNASLYYLKSSVC